MKDFDAHDINTFVRLDAYERERWQETIELGVFTDQPHSANIDIAPTRGLKRSLHCSTSSKRTTMTTMMEMTMPILILQQTRSEQ